VSPETIIDAGATGFRELVPPAQLPGVLVAYAKSIDRVFYLVVGLSVVQVFAACGLGWKDVRKKAEVGGTRGRAEEKEKGDV
jgi:hypothetical protein